MFILQYVRFRAPREDTHEANQALPLDKILPHGVDPNWKVADGGPVKVVPRAVPTEAEKKRRREEKNGQDTDDAPSKRRKTKSLGAGNEKGKRSGKGMSRADLDKEFAKLATQGHLAINMLAHWGQSMKALLESCGYPETDCGA